MQIAHECIPTNCVTIRHNDKIWMTSEIRKDIRIRDRLMKQYIKNKIGTNERKYKNQRNKVNSLKKSAKENFQVSINESLSELKNTNSKQYWKTIKMLIKGEGQSSEYIPHYVVQTRTTQVHSTNLKMQLALTITSVPQLTCKTTTYHYQTLTTGVPIL